MFLHSGASLHGHEFSKRTTQAGPTPNNLGNPLLRSAFTAPTSRTTVLNSLSHDKEAVPDLKKSKTDPAPPAQTSDQSSICSTGFNHDPQTPQLQAMMSEDRASTISDTDASKVSSSIRRKRQSVSQKNATFVLAHPPPKLRTKQRIIHVRPNLVLQVQQVAAGLRPRPAIDVYPSFAGARSIMAPLLKRVPGIAGIKRELSGQDIMLVKSDDYTTQASNSESESDEDNIAARDLLGIISPSKTEDRAEIILANGAIWVATTRSNGSSYSYEMTSTDPTGTPITARWVRKQVVSSSLPSTPTMPGPSSMKPQLSDTRFTFSIIDPNSRRHPILATLTSASLTIPETYTTLSPAPKPYPLGSPKYTSTDSPSDGDEGQTERHTELVQEWQKSFISISAVWVALRHGWVPDFRPEDFMPFRSLPASTAEGCSHGRRRSLSASAEPSPSPSYSEGMGYRKYPVGMRQHSLQSSNDLPRRATSTGGAFIHMKRTVLDGNNDQPVESRHERMIKLNRRAISGDWNVGLSKGARQNSIAEFMMDSAPVSPKNEPAPTSLAPPPIPVEYHAASARSHLGSLSPDLSNNMTDSTRACADAPQIHSEQGGNRDASPKCRHRKRASIMRWFRKLSER
ncbi:hypothetical protein F4777DRAFT_113977 [Nemania sp. FL0916]|nr:hypothetical protein F4777DRAFT_113977 [Nemania sp. FL0916]